MDVVTVGLGLIGGSMAKAAVRAGHAVKGVDPHPPAGAGFPVFADVPEGLFANAPLVILAVPPSAAVPWIEQHESSFAPGTLVTDVTGVKTTVCRALERYAFQDRWMFVGGHPMAGKEVSGFENAEADLFKGASMILTPYPTCGRKPLEILEAFFTELGFGRVVFTTPEHHDRMIALTSQLAHVVSSAYIRDPLAPEHAGYSAGSFRDMTRVARLDPDTWTDLFLANRDALLETLDGFISRLGEYRNAIAAKDASALRSLLAAGRAARMKSWR